MFFAVPVSDIFPLLIAMSLLTGFFYWFFKPISGGEFEKLRIYAIVIHLRDFRVKYYGFERF